MKITGTEITYYRWPRPVALVNSTHTHSDVAMGVLKVHTDAGITGIGVAGAKPGERQFMSSFCERLIGLDPMMSEHVWATLWNPKLSGRRGLETRALSAIDFAVWDIKARVAQLPLHVLLGGSSRTIPTYVAGGYYAAGKTLDDLVEEMGRYVALGARAVKMKVGALSPADDALRVKLVREAIGSEVALMLDANCGYRYFDAIQFARRVIDYDIYWLEEPVAADDYEGMRKISAAVPITLACGENEYTKFGFRDLIATEAVGILQPDARHMGGITEFMKVAAMAQAHGLDIAPHGDQQAHLHLMAAIPNGLMIEYYPAEFDPMFGKVYLDTQVLNGDGTVSVPTAAGNGCEFNEDALAPYAISAGADSSAF